MKKISETKQVSETWYEADDGTKFYHRRECAYYEWTCQADKLFVLYIRGHRDPRGEKPRLFTDEDDANDAVPEGSSSYVDTIYIDNEIWEKQYEEMQKAKFKG